MAISGDTVVVGASEESSKATGINGDQTDNSAQFSGAAYVFVRNGTTWSQQAYLKASNTNAQDFFGVSVAISGDTAVVSYAGTYTSSGRKDSNMNVTAAPFTSMDIWQKQSGKWKFIAGTNVSTQPIPAEAYKSVAAAN